MNRWLIPALSLFAVTLCPAQAVKGDIQPVIEGMRSEISARPSRVLIAVEDALTMNEQAACEIVQEAIVSTRADAKLVGEIVYTALKHAPGMAATIVECALRTAPGARAEIKLAMQRALGEGVPAKKTGETAAVDSEAGAVESNESASGKQTSGKSGAGTGDGPAGDEPFPVDDFLGIVGVGGIYLLTPSSHSFRPCDPDDPCCHEDLSRACLVP